MKLWTISWLKNYYEESCFFESMSFATPTSSCVIHVKWPCDLSRYEAWIYLLFYQALYYYRIPTFTIIFTSVLYNVLASKPKKIPPQSSLYLLHLLLHLFWKSEKKKEKKKTKKNVVFLIINNLHNCLWPANIVVQS